jgi:hypothetical protein
VSARGPYRLSSGAVLQAGLATAGHTTRPANGLQMRGVVLKVYTVDNPNHPAASTADKPPPRGLPVALYADVLCYTAIQGFQKILINKALVTQDTGGMQRGKIWKPRASTQTAKGDPLRPQDLDVANLDGDHVLVSFLDNNLNAPMIVRGLSHPFSDQGQTDAQAFAANLRLKIADGSPSLEKHNGTYFGISAAGDYLTNTLYANDGTLEAKGIAPPPPTSGAYGNLIQLLHAHAQRLTRLLDMSDPASPVEVAREVLTATSYTLKFLEEGNAGPGACIAASGQDDAAFFAVGDAAMHAAIEERLRPVIENLISTFNNHSHFTPVGVSSTATASGFVAKPYDPQTYGAHMAFPDTKSSEVP